MYKAWVCFQNDNILSYRWGKSARDDAKKYGNDDVMEIIDKYKKMKLHRVS